MFALRTIAVSVALCAVASSQTVSDAITTAREALGRRGDDGRAEAERLLSGATNSCRNPLATEKQKCAEASVLLGLILLGDQRPMEEIRPLAEEAVRLYEQTSPAVDDAQFALALDLATVASDSVGDTARAGSLRQRAVEIRTRIFRNLQAADTARTVEAIRIGPDIGHPRPTFKPEPAYSDAARIARRQGAILVSVVIDADGSVRDIKLLRSIGFGLDEKGYEAVRAWRFDPATRDGKPVAVSANIEMNFRLM